MRITVKIECAYLAYIEHGMAEQKVDMVLSDAEGFKLLHSGKLEQYVYKRTKAELANMIRKIVGDVKSKAYAR